MVEIQDVYDDLEIYKEQNVIANKRLKPQHSHTDNMGGKFKVNRPSNDTYQITINKQQELDANNMALLQQLIQQQQMNLIPPNQNYPNYPEEDDISYDFDQESMMFESLKKKVMAANNLNSQGNFQISQGSMHKDVTYYDEDFEEIAQSLRNSIDQTLKKATQKSMITVVPLDNLQSNVVNDYKTVQQTPTLSNQVTQGFSTKQTLLPEIYNRKVTKKINFSSNNGETQQQQQQKNNFQQAQETIQNYQSKLSTQIQDTQQQQQDLLKRQVTTARNSTSQKSSLILQNPQFPSKDIQFSVLSTDNTRNNKSNLMEKFNLNNSIILEQLEQDNSFIKSKIQANSKVNQTIDYPQPSSKKVINYDSRNLQSINIDSISSKKNSSSQSISSIKIVDRQVRVHSQSQRPGQGGNIKIQSLLNASRNLSQEKNKRVFERPKPSDSVILLQSQNHSIKEELSNIIDQVSQKLIMAREKQSKNLQQMNDETYQEVKRKEKKIKLLSIQRVNLQHEIESFNFQLDEVYNHHRVQELKNDFITKQKYLGQLKLDYQFNLSLKEKEDRRIDKTVRDQGDSDKKSQLNQQIREVKMKIRQIVKDQRVTSSLLKEQHGQILSKENDCKKLIDLIKKAKLKKGQGGQEETVKESDIQETRVLIEQGKNEIKTLLKQKASKEKGFVKVMEDLEQKVISQTYELKLFDLKLKDKENETRLMNLRHKEIEKQIEDYRKLQRNQKQQQQKVRMAIASSQHSQQDDQGKESDQVFLKPPDTPIIKQVEREQSGSNFFTLTQVDGEEEQEIIVTLNQDETVKRRLEEKRREALMNRPQEQNQLPTIEEDQYFTQTPSQQYEPIEIVDLNKFQSNKSKRDFGTQPPQQEQQYPVQDYLKKGSSAFKKPAFVVLKKSQQL